MEIVILALPSVVGFIFTALLMQKKSKTLAERFMLFFLLVTSLFLLFDSYTVYPQAYSQAKVFCLICNAFFAPCIGITICFVSWSLSSVRQRYFPIFLSSYLLACAVFLVELLNYIGFGFGRAADYFEHDRMFPAACESDTYLYHIYSTFEYMAIYVYNVICIISFVVSLCFACFLCYASNLTPVTFFNFLFRRGPLRVLHVWFLALLILYIFSSIRIYYGSHYLTKHPETTIGLYIFATLGMFALGMVALRLRRPCVYVVRPHKMPMYDDLPVRILELEEKDKQEESYSSYDDDEEADSYRTLNVRDALRRLMRDQACFLYPGQSRYYVADTVGLRRDSLDRTMRVLYHLDYQVYVMVQKVEYCRRYRDRYSNESEVEISMACGFTSLKEMQYEWRECRAYFRRADQALAEDKQRQSMGMGVDELD